jgi:hypothetical protein
MPGVLSPKPASFNEIGNLTTNGSIVYKAATLPFNKPKNAQVQDSFSPNRHGKKPRPS